MEMNENINKSTFVFDGDVNKQKDTINRPSVTYWQDSWRKLKRIN